MTPSQRRTLFERLREKNPHPTTELIAHSPFELLIAVVLSAQATDLSVNKATARLFPTTPQAILDLGEDNLKKAIQTIGLFNRKAAHLIATAQILIERHQGVVPSTREALEALPGVGRKTANVILNTAFGQPTMAVDTHVFRVANRTGLAKGKTPLAVERGLLKHIAPDFLKEAHHWLILHGRYVCVARKPHCASCVLRDLCDYAQEHFEVPHK